MFQRMPKYHGVPRSPKQFWSCPISFRPEQSAVHGQNRRARKVARANSRSLVAVASGSVLTQENSSVQQVQQRQSSGYPRDSWSSRILQLFRHNFQVSNLSTFLGVAKSIIPVVDFPQIGSTAGKSQHLTSSTWKDCSLSSRRGWTKICVYPSRSQMPSSIWHLLTWLSWKITCSFSLGPMPTWAPRCNLPSPHEEGPSKKPEA